MGKYSEYTDYSNTELKEEFKNDPDMLAEVLAEKRWAREQERIHESTRNMRKLGLV